MNPKQDRAVARTPEDLERKYNLGKLSRKLEEATGNQNSQYTKLSQSLEAFRIAVNQKLEQFESELSSLKNDSGEGSSETVSAAVAQHNVDTAAHNDLRLAMQGLSDSKVSVTDIVNDLVTNVPDKPLSAAQGVVIKSLIEGLESGKLSADALTDAINTALAQAKASGEFDGADGYDGSDGQDGYTPVRGIDYWTDSDKAAIVQDVLAALPVWTGGSY